MPFLAINGISFSVANGNASADEVVIGESGRAFDGTLIATTRAFKREWKLKTALLTWAAAEALKDLLRGKGHRWSFDSDLYSDKGLAATGAGVSVGTSAPAPKYGAGRATVTNGSTASFAASLGSSWTVCVWKWNGASWDHWIKTSGGSQWKNGATDATATAWLAVSSGTLTLTGDGADRYYDDVVALPYVVPSDWPAQIYAAGVAFSALPKLNATGDMVGSSGATVFGEVGGTAFAQASVSSWAQNNEAFDFVLREA